MEVLRVPPYPITTTWDVPEANAQYTIYVEDLVDHSFETLTVTSDANSKIQYILPRSKAQFDREFLFRVHEVDINGEIVVDSNLTVYRPYVDPNMLGTTASEIMEYKELEIVARSIIDTFLQEGSGTGGAFYNHKLIIQQVGQGTDYFPLWHNTNRVLKVYENNVLVYDYDTKTDWELQYAVTLDNTSIYRFPKSELTSPTSEYNRTEYSPTHLPIGMGDLGFYGRSGYGVAFPKGYDYVFIVDAGYKAIPPDVELATKYLIEDIKCGNNDYWKRFITQYSTDQFDVKFAPQFLEGTGNIIVDKILSNYKGNLLKPGIL
jgi:hypothetical protein